MRIIPDRSIVSFLLVALRRPVPHQVPDLLVGLRPEQGGADRLREGRVVEGDREVVAGLLAAAVPRRAYLAVVCGVDAMVRRILGIGVLGRADGQLDVQGERPDMAGIAGLGLREGAYLGMACSCAVAETGPSRPGGSRPGELSA